MKKVTKDLLKDVAFVSGAIVLTCTAVALCSSAARSDEAKPDTGGWNWGRTERVQPGGTQDAYGPNRNSDGTGRSWSWRTRKGGDALGPVRPGTLGPDTGTDSTGRPVRREYDGD